MVDWFSTWVRTFNNHEINCHVFFTGICGPQRMTPTGFGDHLTCPLLPLWSWILFLHCLVNISITTGWIIKTLCHSGSWEEEPLVITWFSLYATMRKKKKQKERSFLNNNSYGGDLPSGQTLWLNQIIQTVKMYFSLSCRLCCVI